MSALQRRTVGGGRGGSVLCCCALQSVDLASSELHVCCLCCCCCQVAHEFIWVVCIKMNWSTRRAAELPPPCLLPSAPALAASLLLPGAWCRVIAHLPRQARQRSKLLEAAAMQNWKFKWLTWQHVAVLDGHRQQQQPETKTETKLEQQLVRSCSLSPSLSLSLTLSLALLHVMIKFW